MIRIWLLLFLAGFTSCAPNNRTNWFKNAVVYQIYPRSFKDSNGDGIGDLNGITSKLEHIRDLGVAALWLSPIYTSPQADFGYDIANFTDVDPDYGTLADFDKLVAKARTLGLKVLLDFVPNHSSHLHPWFVNSERRIKPYDEYYVWRNARIVNGTRSPPNNWLSTFQGSAWKWSDVRKQYYLHQFVDGQPDLNYRNQGLNQQMKNVLQFWLNRGVEGFRIDAINHMFEDTRFLNEPSANRPDLPVDDYDSLDHTYTKNQPETYQVLSSWRKLLDDHSNRTNSDRKVILTEAYAPHDLTIKYYNHGSNVPFNFIFMSDLNSKSTAAQFRLQINKWMASVPQGKVANWVVGNHDNHRVASRFGSRRGDQITMLSMILPGVTVVYNGDEIGMIDRNFTYEETVDPAGCNAGPDRYYLKSRDPERTPFQWDSSTSAGFSNTTKTWLPVHSNYKTLNLAAQKTARVSHYKVFKALVALKKRPIIASGSVQVTVVATNILAVVRKSGTSVATLLVNISARPVTINAKSSLDLPPQLWIYIASVESGLSTGTKVNTTSVLIPGAASVVLTTPGLIPRN
ncbi:alpha-glucosidase [Lasioglossum baleicum]|uniref:alpha-glucosidase n=1 Tax=Lasioglossum baleicum TaxID=434251 RepID=UPI003FCC9EA0